MAGLSQRLFRLGRPNLERQLAHPTVRGIANGDLDQKRFRAWLVQDYLFLLDYVRLFALAAARAPDTDTLGRLVDLAHATYHEELSLHRAYAAEFGLTEVDLDRAEKSPVCAAYTDFLLRTAATGEFAEVLAALLPCMWGYSELGRALAATGLPTEPRYRRWIQTYADPGFAELAAWCADLLDRAADGLPAARLAACEHAFLTSLRHEHAFWDAE
ncbi:MAG TPA: thiaminase II [Actinomycetes bacterium]|nr:thiaminase II [Actinomycetes bacterium]